MNKRGLGGVFIEFLFGFGFWCGLPILANRSKFEFEYSVIFEMG